MGTSAHARPASTTGALALLTLPPLDKLTERQVRGIVCVWDGVPLLTSIAVDLGARQGSRAGTPVAWSPRACRRCTYQVASEQLHAHCVSDDCPNDIDRCTTCKGLLRVIREYRR